MITTLNRYSRIRIISYKCSCLAFTITIYQTRYNCNILVDSRVSTHNSSTTITARSPYIISNIDFTTHYRNTTTIFIISCPPVIPR